MVSSTNRISISPSPLPPTKPGPLPTKLPPQYRVYAAHLHKMSMKDLQAEKAKQEQRLYIAEHGIRYDPETAKDARIKLALVNREIASRKGDGSLKAYKQEVRKMSDKQLIAEAQNQRQNLWEAEHGIRYDPEGIARAKARLAICMEEASRRGLAIPIPRCPPYMPLPK